MNNKLKIDFVGSLKSDDLMPLIIRSPQYLSLALKIDPFQKYFNILSYLINSPSLSLSIYSPSLS